MVLEHLRNAATAQIRLIDFLLFAPPVHWVTLSLPTARRGERGSLIVGTFCNERGKIIKQEKRGKRRKKRAREKLTLSNGISLSFLSSCPFINGKLNPHPIFRQQISSFLAQFNINYSIYQNFNSGGAEVRSKCQVILSLYKSIFSWQTLKDSPKSNNANWVCNIQKYRTQQIVFLIYINLILTK